MAQCLCDKAANSSSLIFRDCIDHEIRPEGIQPHGYDNMPIVSDGNTLGVLNLYVTHGHNQTKLAQNFLSASAKTSAGIIERHKLSYIDSLTGIPHRRNFMSQFIESRENRLFATLFIDSVDLKPLTTRLAMSLLTSILIEVTRRAQNNVRDTDIIARLAGDEFTVILEKIPSADKVNMKRGL
ncbi:MAG: GGDEF domain-containing protein [Cycloclasticus sp.]